MPMIQVIFPEIYIELNKEAALHPGLAERLATQKLEDFEVRLAEILAYLNVPVDGVFTPDEIEAICERCYWALREKRTQVIVPLH